MAAVIASLLCSCTRDTSNSSWLVGTVWEADLAGREYEGGTLRDGIVRIKFTNPGYQYYADLQSKTSSGSLGPGLSTYVHSRIEVEYDFPSITIPFVDSEKSKDDNVVIGYYNTGFFSEDLKTLHFDTFTVFQGSFDTIVFQDVTFFSK